MTDQAQKTELFVNLHRRDGVFLIPNPWDAGSARILEAQGIESLATTSSGFAQTLGCHDGKVSPDEMFQHCAALCEATTIPISADLENCYGDGPDEVAVCLSRFAESGIVGASVEDYAPGSNARLYDFDHAVERVHAGVEAAAKLPFKFLLTARAENLLRGRNDIEDTIRRLQAFEAAGADVLYAPGLTSLDDVRLVTQSVDRPVNVLGTFLHQHTIDEIGAAGAKRVSTGGGLARLVVGALLAATHEMQSTGSQSWVANCAGFADVETAFSPD